MTDQLTRLTRDVYVPPTVRIADDGLPHAASSPFSATLICRERNAVLVDALLTTGQGERLAVWRKRLLTAAVMTAAAAWGGETDG